MRDKTNRCNVPLWDHVLTLVFLPACTFPKYGWVNPAVKVTSRNYHSLMQGRKFCWCSDIFLGFHYWAACYRTSFHLPNLEEKKTVLVFLYFPGTKTGLRTWFLPRSWDKILSQLSPAPTPLTPNPQSWKEKPYGRFTVVTKFIKVLLPRSWDQTFISQLAPALAPSPPAHTCVWGAPFCSSCTDYLLSWG